jgi:outer membrane protein
MMKFFAKYLAGCVCMLSIFWAQNAWAGDEFKVGYVSLDRLISEAEPAKKARARLDKEFKAREKALDKSSERAREAQREYERDFDRLSPEQRTQQETLIRKELELFETDRASFETDLANAQNKLLQDLLRIANVAIKKIAEQEGYDLVIQEAVYIKAVYDMTPKVIEFLK